MNASKKIIIGNWKSNNGTEETKVWLEAFLKIYTSGNHPDFSGLTAVICPPFICLEAAAGIIKNENLPIKLGSQNISPFGPGAYTGEISALMLKNLVNYSLVGHSERRQYFKEDDEVLGKKVNMALENGIVPVYCVPDDKTLIPQNVTIAAYEPVWAIGTGKAEAPEKAGIVARSIRSKNPNLQAVIYGGSVSPANIKSLLTEGGIDGVLPGKSSLDPAIFWEMMVNASNN